MDEKDLLERFVVAPSTKVFGGIRVTKDVDLEVYNSDSTVHQTVKDGILTTKITKTYGDEYETYEECTLTQVVPDGTILIWGEDTGYIIPNYNMVNVEEAISNLELLKEIKDNPVNVQ